MYAELILRNCQKKAFLYAREVLTEVVSLHDYSESVIKHGQMDGPLTNKAIDRQRMEEYEPLYHTVKPWQQQ